ncbi:L-histidine N(alpha)-methyltransferase [Microbulbifer flavimaris]|uniref:L-histidine N(Alpha)-methyltransferase n=1 Tax=Microbulbifer flavimaris TaxID=1781068 RepID=A0ABX4I339_9GAMM|nr:MULTISPECIES: L-histidine N(alpha)-methyltransferase [Microbulbifer]KUJ84743.1 dimethylhistidine N-methyltransferase [Microbulbifer sp. ZGT114]PCO06837.1 L-histidine N(alpha)-methyltransferase [Microbulbifer flavimaris]
MAVQPPSSGTKTGTETFLRDVIDGLSRPQKTLPCKYLYDEAGSQLFEEICELKDYYVTRTEAGIFAHSIKEMAEAIGPGALIIEPGAGNCEKVEPLLTQLDSPAGYMPMDISPEILLSARRRIQARLPGLKIHAGIGDFTKEMVWDELPALEAHRRVIFFPGSTIGNFDPEQASTLLHRFASRLGQGDAVLIGTDLDKDPIVLERAYNDSEQVTARFNKNLLSRINVELDADFDLSRFSHRSFYHPLRRRVEMHLVSLAAQTVRVSGEDFHFREGETIHTENSHKYTLSGFEKLLRKAGFSPLRHWSDSSDYYAIHFAEVR